MINLSLLVFMYKACMYVCIYVCIYVCMYVMYVFVSMDNYNIGERVTVSI
jgi:hypothetical protein